MELKKFLYVMVICCQVLLRVVCDDNNKFAFTQQVYNAFFYPVNTLSNAINNVMHDNFRMGIPNQVIKYNVTFKMRGSVDVMNTFVLEPKLIGDFYYITLRLKYFITVIRENHKIYNITVLASDGDKAKAQTNVLVRVIDKNDNCPIFTMDNFKFSVKSDINTATEIGRIRATDADQGFYKEIFYYLIPTTGKQEFPFVINPFTGGIFAIDNLRYYGEKLEEYVTKVYANHRGGDSSLISCSVISQATLSIKVLPTNLYPPEISVFTLRYRFDPDFNSWDYAEIVVSDKDVSNSSNVRFPVIIKTTSLTSSNLFGFYLIPTSIINKYILRIVAVTKSTVSKTNQIKIVIEAIDLGLPSKSTLQPLTFLLESTQNLNLLTLPTLTTINITENCIVNSVIGLLRPLIKTDNPNSIFQLFFELHSDPNDAYLLKDIAVSRSGVVRVIKKLDAENFGIRDRNFTIGVGLKGQSKVQKGFTMRILVQDINEFPPLVNNNNTHIFIKENAKLGTVVLNINAYDPDCSRTKLNFYLYNEKNRLPFKINPFKTSQLILAEKLDAETLPKKFHIRILITDSGKPFPRSTVAFYTIDIEDVNEYGPEFIYKNCNLIISRNASYGFKIGTFFAEDLDRDDKLNIKVSIKSISLKDPCFNLNPKTGDLTLLCSLKYQSFSKINNISITLQASDGYFLSEELILNVKIADSKSRELQYQQIQKQCQENNIYQRMQDNFNKLNNYYKKTKEDIITKLPIRIIREKPKLLMTVPQTIHVREELKIGHVISVLKVEQIHQNDPYNSMFEFGIWTEDPNDQLAFLIDKITDTQANLIIKDRVDRETVESYRLVIKICDMGDPEYCTLVKTLVKIEDINDNPPYFLDSFQLPIEIPEDYKVNRRIVHVKASDLDSSDNIQYKLINFRNVFKIHKRTGWLKLRSELDHEKQAQYELVITATDVGDTPSSFMTSTTTLTILVFDVNDNKPMFSKNQNFIYVPEDMPVNSFLTKVTATDRDSGENGIVEYEIFGTNSKCIFCDFRTGALYLKCDFKKYTELKLILTANDGGDPYKMFGQTELIIRSVKSNLNIYPPLIDKSLLELNINENIEPGTVIYKLKITDLDKRKSYQNDPSLWNLKEKYFKYTITGNSSGLNYFHIQGDGEIQVLHRIDRELTPDMWLFVYIEDRHSEANFRTLLEIYIKIDDVNDNWPMPDKAEYFVSFPENTSSIKGQSLLQLSGYDPDYAENSELKYKIISGDLSGHFDIDKSGRLTVTERLPDREFYSSKINYCKLDGIYNLQVTISDKGIPEHRNVFAVTVTMKDVNDNAPEFINNNNFVFTIYWNPSVNNSLVLGRVLALDEDEFGELNSAVRYTLSPRDDVESNDNTNEIYRLFAVNSDNGVVSFKDIELINDIMKSLEDNHNNNNSIAYQIKIWGYDLGEPTQWSRIAATVTIQLLMDQRYMNNTNATESLINVTNNKSGLYLAYDLPETLQVFYDQCVGSEIVQLPIVDTSDPSGLGIQANILDSTLPFIILMTDSTNHKYKKASLIIAESLNKSIEKYVVKIRIRNSIMFFDVKIDVLVQYYDKSRPVFSVDNSKTIQLNISDRITIPSIIFNVTLANPPLLSKIQRTSNIESNPVTYSITASNAPEIIKNLFYLHSNNGELRVIAPLRNYRNRTFHIIIEAHKKTTAYMKLAIHITETNSATPHFIVNLQNAGMAVFLVNKLLVDYKDYLTDDDHIRAQHYKNNGIIASIVWIDMYSLPSTWVTSVVAVDSDFGMGGLITYSIKNDTISQYFKIDPRSGEIFTKKSIEKLKNRLLFVEVLATDNGIDIQHSNKCVVAVLIRNQHEFVQLPQFLEDNVEVSIEEEQPINTIVYCLKLKPIKNHNEAVHVQFEMLKSTNRGTGHLFGVTQDSGCIITSVILDKEVTSGPVIVQIQVRNYKGQTAKFNSVAKIRINIIDLNDNSPSFLGPIHLSGFISEDANPGSLIFQSSSNLLHKTSSAVIIRATDLDSGLNGEFDYHINSKFHGHQYFQIDKHTGVLSLRQPLDRETVGDRIVLFVWLQDYGTPSLNSLNILEIVISIIDVNDNAPKFDREFYIQNLQLPTYPGALILQLRATDKDLIPEIRYSLDTTSSKTVKYLSYFVINSTTGWLSINEQLVPKFDELPHVLIINVIADDGAHTSLVNVTLYCSTEGRYSTESRILKLERNEIEWVVEENFISTAKETPSILLPKTSVHDNEWKSDLNIRYILLTPHPKFHLDTIIGLLTIIEPLDREEKSIIPLSILARSWNAYYAYVNVTVTVTDINDNRPLFLSDKYHLLLDTKTDLASQTIWVRAIDTDAGNNGSIEYSVESIRPYPDDINFHFNKTTGVFQVTDILKSDLIGRQYQLSVKASDQGRPVSLSTYTTLTIDIVSDRSPMFDQTNYTVSVWEDTVMDTVLVKLTARSSTGHTIMYTINDGNQDELFELDFNTGVIRLVGQLDYEKKSNYSLLVSSTDPKSSLSQSTTVQINVLNRDDEIPKFIQTEFSSTLSELASLGTFILEIKINNSITNKKVHYSIKKEPNVLKCRSEFFDFQGNSNRLILIKSVDYEICTQHIFWVTVMFNNQKSLSKTVLVKIKIIDENDNKPQFVSTHFTGQISDTSQPGSLVTVAMATDVDTHSKLKYKLIDDRSNLFRIEPNSGFIKLTKQPNFLDPMKFEFSVLVHDSLFTNQANVSVSLVNSLNNAPKFTSPKIHMSIAEDISIGSKLGKLEAKDIDKNDVIHYKVIGGESNRFSLDSDKGDISTNSKLDRELKNRYEFRVVATDNRGGNDYSTVFIHVTDINDNAPYFSRDCYEITLLTFILEDKYDNQFPVIQLQAQDPDRNPRFRLNYQLVNNTSPTSKPFPITVDSITGAINFNYKLWKGQRDSKSVNKTDNWKIPFHVRVCEEAVLSYRSEQTNKLCSDQVPVVIYLWSLHYIPVITCSIKSIQENNPANQIVAICRVNKDKDFKGGWRILKSQKPNDLVDFDIDSELGFVKAKNIMDYEKKSNYQIIVEYRVVSHEIMSSRSISIVLIDQNDCFPQFDNTRYSVSIREDVKIGSKLIQCLAKDADKDGLEVLTYALANNTGDHVRQLFKIDQKGWIIVKNEIDYENRSSFVFQVSATDTVGHTTLVEVDIAIENINDEHPYWTKLEDTITIEEVSSRTYQQTTDNTPYSSLIYQLQVFDNDSISSSNEIAKYKYQFFIINQNINSLLVYFRISDKGEIFLTKPLDAERIPNQQLILEIMVSDGKLWSKNIFKLTILIKDVNDEFPYCIQPDELEMEENMPPGTEITRLIAYDNDASAANNKLTYKIIECNGPYLLMVDPANGVVILNAPLDREKHPASIVFIVEAGDVDSVISANHKCQFHATLKIKDVNDNIPVFTHTEIAPLPEDAPFGSVVGKIHATDKDVGIHRKIIYGLTEDSYGKKSETLSSQLSFFTIDKQTGIVRVAGLLDRERIESHKLLITATDCDGLPQCGGNTNTPLTATATVTVKLIDVNDNPPQFIGLPYQINASENSLVNTRLMQVSAVSADVDINAVISYKLVDNTLSSSTERNGKDYKHFRLDSESGILTLIKTLDYETVREFFLIIEASDGGTPSLSTTTVITINVIDVNDNEPKFPSEPYWFTLPENSPINKLVGKITALDADSGNNSRVLYTLQGWSNDHEWQNRSQLNPVDKYFQLDQNSGQLSLTIKPDREIQSIYRIDVMAMDHGRPVLSSSTRVIVEIEDMNDNAPTLEEESYRFLIQIDRNGIIPESSFKRSDISKNLLELARLRINDKDGARNSKPFSCRLHSPEPHSQFSVQIHPTRDDFCVILINQPIKYDLSHQFNQSTPLGLKLGIQNLQIQVGDQPTSASTGLSLYSQTNVAVHVVRLSNIPPEIVSQNISLTYFHQPYQPYVNQPTYLSNIARIAVRDSSPFYDMLLRFHFVINQTVRETDKNLLELFKIGSENGLISALKQLDSGTYPIEIKVTNGSLSTQKTIYINVLALTNDMIESTCIIQLSPMLPTEFLSNNLQTKLVNFIKKSMASELVYVISLKSINNFQLKQRVKRSIKDSNDATTAILISVYNAHENQFFPSSILTKRLAELSNNMRSLMRVNKVDVFNNVCQQNPADFICIQGVCKTDIRVSRPRQYNSGVSRNSATDSTNHFTVFNTPISAYSAPKFSYEAVCECEEHFGGNRCEIPLNKCAHKPCMAPRLCQPDPIHQPGFKCVCPMFRSGRYCEQQVNPDTINGGADTNVCLDKQCFDTRESNPISFSGGGYMIWFIKSALSVRQRLDIRFSFRCRQLDQSTPLMQIDWNSMRSILVEITKDGRLKVLARYGSGWTITEVITYSGLSESSLADGRWHSLKLTLVGVQLTSLKYGDTFMNDYNWWIHVVLDGVSPVLRSLEAWNEGDPLGQNVTIAAHWLNLNNGVQSRLLKTTAIACFKNIKINHKKMPYQQFLDTSSNALVEVKSINLHYGCPDLLLDSSCARGLCRNGGQCLIGGSSRNISTSFTSIFVCQCQSSFSGKFCERFNHPCKLKPCFHNSKCQPTKDGWFKCICPPGLSGPQCGQGNACSEQLNPCPRHSSCEEYQLDVTNLVKESSGLATAAVCRCSQSFQGYRCQDDVNECLRYKSQITSRKNEDIKSVCYPGHGTCHNTWGSYICNCSLGYGGRNCELDTIIPLHKDSNSNSFDEGGLSRFHIYLLIGLLVCLFVLALLTVVVLLVRFRPVAWRRWHCVNGPAKQRPDTGSTSAFLALDPVYQYKYHPGYTGNDQGSRYSPASSMLGSAIHAVNNNNTGYIGGYVIEPPAPSTPSGANSTCSHNYRHQIYDSIPADRISLGSSSAGLLSVPKRDGSQPMSGNRYQKSSRPSNNPPYIPPGDARRRLSQHSSTYSLIPCNVGTQQHVHLIPQAHLTSALPQQQHHQLPLAHPHFQHPHQLVTDNHRNSVFVYPTPIQHRMVYDPHQMMIRNSNLSLHSARSPINQWENSSEVQGESIEMQSNPPGSVMLQHHLHHYPVMDSSNMQSSPINGETNKSLISWNGQYNDDSVPNKEMISSQEMSLTETTERSTAFLIPKSSRNNREPEIKPTIPSLPSKVPSASQHPDSLVVSMDVDHNQSTVLTNHNYNGNEDSNCNSNLGNQQQSSNTVSPSTASLPSGVTNSSADTKGTAPHDLIGIKKRAKVSTDSNSAAGTECDTEDLDMDQPPLIVESSINCNSNIQRSNQSDCRTLSNGVKNGILNSNSNDEEDEENDSEGEKHVEIPLLDSVN